MIMYGVQSTCLIHFNILQHFDQGYIPGQIQFINPRLKLFYNLINVSTLTMAIVPRHKDSQVAANILF